MNEIEIRPTDDIATVAHAVAEVARTSKADLIAGVEVTIGMLISQLPADSWVGTFEELTHEGATRAAGNLITMQRVSPEPLLDFPADSLVDWSSPLHGLDNIVDAEIVEAPAPTRARRKALTKA